MKHLELLELHKSICLAAYCNLDAKNSDYSPRCDALRTVGQFGQLGVLVRLSDKLGRLRTLVETGKTPSVADEKEYDTVIDAINYLVLYLALRKEADDDAQNKKEAEEAAAPEAHQSTPIRSV